MPVSLDPWRERRRRTEEVEAEEEEVETEEEEAAEEESVAEAGVARRGPQVAGGRRRDPVKGAQGQGAGIWYSSNDGGRDRMGEKEEERAREMR